LLAIETDEADWLVAKPPAVQRWSRRLPKRTNRDAGRCRSICLRKGGSSGAVHLPKLRQALRKIGEDVTETLDYVPSSFKVIRRRREKFACRGLRHGGPPAAHRPIVRGRAGGLLAHIVASKPADHLPLYLRPRSM
jgi:hypothetical protein